ncbi:MAG TPA: response regulator transcription factor [Acidimicrobiales bacterium]|nr:response regulator transcription factor [Acidimicrobiales bacterium]
MTEPIRILLVDDDPALRDLLTVALQREGWDVESVSDAGAAEQALEDAEPDLAILDIHLGPGADGFTLAKRLRQRSDLPFIFLTDESSIEARLAGFATGADDYLPKPFVLAELIARVRALLRRAGRSGHPVLRVGPLRIDEHGRRVLLDGEAIELTRIEFELLSALARQAGRVASKAALLAQVWGFDGYDQNLVEVHVSSLRRKLGPSGRPLLQTVRGVGYVLRAEASTF